MNNTIIYRCTKDCPINKKCFILKSSTPIETPIEILQKCPASKGRDIPIVIGGNCPN